MKKFLAIASIGLAASVAALASGCGGNTRNLASLASNWYSASDYKKIQPAFTEGNENFRPEKLTYSVTQSANSNNGVYSAEYADGTYTTEFFAKKIYQNELEKITDEDWRDEYAAKMSGGNSGAKFIVLYCYKTELEIPRVKFKFGDEEKTFEKEYRRTVSYFLPIENFLSPVYSMQEVKSATPASAKPVKPQKLEDCYEEVNRAYESFYTLSGSAVKTKGYDNLSGRELILNTEVGLGNRQYSIFDCAYLDIAVRGMKNMSSSMSQTICVYTPGAQAADYTVIGSGAALSDDAEQAQKQLGEIEDILKEKNLFVPDENGHTQTTALNVVYNGVFSGVSQRYWFAKAGDGKNSRTIMVKYSAPLAYDSGCIDYLLNDIQSLPSV